MGLFRKPKIVKDAAAAAEWISQALSQAGYRADFSPESLREIGRFFDEQTVNGNAKPGGLLSEQLGSRIFALGAYVGEVIRRRNGGDWKCDDRDPNDEINLSIVLKSGTTFSACPAGHETI